MTAYRQSTQKLVGAPLIVGLAMVTIAGAATSSTPTLMWAGAKRVHIMCNVAGGPGIDYVALTKQLCREVKRIAVKGAPMPVETIAIGDPAVLRPDAVTLLVHASITRHGKDRLLAFNIRPYRTSSEQASVLFGAPPRVATITSSVAGSPSLDAAISVALGETLPWRARREGPQPLATRP